MEKMRNMVILKNLPSNIIEQAFIVLKDNQRSKKLEYIDGKNNSFCSNRNGENEDTFIIKEAELLLSSCITDEKATSHVDDIVILNKKYKRLKRLSTALVISLILVIVNLFF